MNVILVEDNAHLLSEDTTSLLLEQSGRSTEGILGEDEDGADPPTVATGTATASSICGILRLAP